MSFMLEVIYRLPRNSDRETTICAIACDYGGALTYREEAEPNTLSTSITLTLEFSDRLNAEEAAITFRRIGEHVEGPMDYGTE